jgi:hypothetical protein
MDKQLRDDWLRAAYETQDATGYSHAASMAPRIGMDPYDNMNDKDLWRKLGRFWKERGFIRGQSTKTGLPFEMVMITADGIRYVEEGDQQTPMQQYTFHGPAYGVFGSQQDFTFEQVIHDLDRQIEERGGEDKEELHRMAAEIREVLKSQNSISRSKFQRWSELANKHFPWLMGPLGSLLVNYAFGPPGGG